jgi:hypothetical protein
LSAATSEAPPAEKFFCRAALDTGKGMVYIKAVNRNATAPTVNFFESDGARTVADHGWLTVFTSRNPAPSKPQPALFIR